MNKISRYDIQGKRTLSTLEKFYLTDVGLARIHSTKIDLGASEETIKREFGAFNSVKDNYPKYVLSLDKFDFSQDGIIHKNIIDWLLET